MLPIQKGTAESQPCALRRHSLQPVPPAAAAPQFADRKKARTCWDLVFLNTFSACAPMARLIQIYCSEIQFNFTRQRPHDGMMSIDAIIRSRSPHDFIARLRIYSKL
jgi:hypothetical protein